MIHLHRLIYENQYIQSEKQVEFTKIGHELGAFKVANEFCCLIMHVILYCKSRIFRMHFIFVYFVRGSFRTKIKCKLKIQSKSENPHPSAAVRKFHAYERSGGPRMRKFSAYEIFWIYSS